MVRQLPLLLPQQTLVVLVEITVDLLPLVQAEVVLRLPIH